MRVGVHAELGEDRRDRQRMRDVRVARSCASGPGASRRRRRRRAPPSGRPPSGGCARMVLHQRFEYRVHTGPPLGSEPRQAAADADAGRGGRGCAADALTPGVAAPSRARWRAGRAPLRPVARRRLAVAWCLVSGSLAAAVSAVSSIRAASRRRPWRSSAHHRPQALLASAEVLSLLTVVNLRVDTGLPARAFRCGSPCAPTATVSDREQGADSRSDSVEPAVEEGQLHQHGDARRPRPPDRSTRVAVARAVPPVASTSSTISTRSPGCERVLVDLQGGACRTRGRTPARTSRTAACPACAPARTRR